MYFGLHPLSVSVCVCMFAIIHYETIFLTIRFMRILIVKFILLVLFSIKALNDFRDIRN